jgi:hypothetical protein
MSIAPDKRLADIVNAVAKEITETEHFATGSIIKTPILYPSGASVVAQVSELRDRYFVTDMGYGYREAEMMGATGFYARSGKALAERFGIRFDNQAFFVAEATRDNLAGAVTIIANASSEAAALSAFKAADRRFEADTDLLYRRLIGVFPKEKVGRDVELAGSSTHKWRIAALVETGKQRVIFEPVSNHHNSVVNAVAKFHDFARLEVPPRRIAMVKSKGELGDLINVLGQAASVMQYDASDEAIHDVAEAA